MAKIPEVLIVDQDRQSRYEAKQLVKRSQFNISGEAGFGTEAVSLAVELKPDLVLCAMAEPVARSLQTVDSLLNALPETPIFGDSTQAIYAGNLYYAAPAPNRWFNASTGYGSLGYGLPAAIGAARAAGGPVVCIAGDGGLQFTLAELGTAVEEGLRVIVLVWNNQGYGEIKSYMVERQITPVGVDLHTPDFVAIARAYGVAGTRMEALEALPALLGEAAARPGPTLIEFDETVVLGG